MKTYGSNSLPTLGCTLANHSQWIPLQVLLSYVADHLGNWSACGPRFVMDAHIRTGQSPAQHRGSEASYA